MTETTTSYELSEQDVRLLASNLRALDARALDALANCAGKEYGYTRPRTEPNYGQAEKCRETLDRIEALAVRFGHPMPERYLRSRDSTEEFFREQDAIWGSEQMLASGNLVGGV